MTILSKHTLTSTTAFLIALGTVATLSLSTTAIAREHHGHKGVPHYLSKALDKLPSEDATAFRATMQKAHEANKASITQIQALHDDIDVILAAKTFDKTAFTSKSDELRKTYEKMRATSDEAFATALATLTQDERKILVNAMSRHDDKRM